MRRLLGALALSVFIGGTAQMALAQEHEGPVRETVEEGATVGGSDAIGEDLTTHGEHGDHGAHHGATAPHPINWTQFHFGKDIHGGELQAGEEPMPPGLLFGLFNFAVFIGILVKFAGPKLATYLRTRHDTIKEQLEEAARLRLEAEKKLAEYTTRISAVDAEVKTLIEEIRAESEAEKEQIRQQAAAHAAAVKRDADARVESEIARARLVLEREVVAAAVSAAERVLRSRTEPADHARMFDTFVTSLGGSHGGGAPPSGGSSGGGSGSPEPTPPPSVEQVETVDEEWS